MRQSAIQIGVCWLQCLIELAGEGVVDNQNNNGLLALLTAGRRHVGKKIYQVSRQASKQCSFLAFRRQATACRGLALHLESSQQSHFVYRLRNARYTLPLKCSSPELQSLPGQPREVQGKGKHPYTLYHL